MKTLFRVLALGILMAAFTSLTFAQDQEPDFPTLFDKFKKELKSPCGQRDAALVTGKLIVEKFGNDELNKDVIEWVKGKMADIVKDDPGCKRNQRYDAAYKDKKWSDFFAVSKEIMAAEGDSPLALDIMLTLVSVGYNRTSVDKNDTFNNETLSYAKMALQKIEAGKTSKTTKWGVFEPFNTKEAAQSWMNKIIGYILYNKQDQKKDGLSYFFKSTQVGSENKNDVSIYVNIGNYYFGEAASLDEKYRAARAANNNTDNDESKALLGLARGYADRGIDAFGRALSIAKTNKAKQADIDSISKTLTDLYKFRFNIAPDAKTPDLDSYVSGLTSKPMPDPSTQVTPVVEEVKPTTTTTSTTPTTTTPTPSTTKPSTTTSTTNKQPMSSATTGTTTEATTATTTKPKTTVKKTVIKKKGTR